MIVVVVVAAVVALVLFGLIMAKGRSRFSDESERFRYVSDLTSQWSRQGSEHGSEHGAAQGSGQTGGQGQGGPGYQVAQSPAEAIDLRDAHVRAPAPGDVPTPASANRAGSSERR